MSEQMQFPKTFEEFAKEYGFKDKEQVYTNGAELIPVFRVKQWLEHIEVPQSLHTDEEIAKSFIEDVEAVKDQLFNDMLYDTYGVTFEDADEVKGDKR